MLRQNVPGITFGAGEGGSYGDSINIRGFSATNDIAVDGVRQSANTTHTDPFDTQAIEVVQGTSSVYSGVGALGGTINFVSKLPTAADFSNVSLGAGTADYVRGTADINHTVGDPDLGMAYRINAMAHRNEVADRDVTSYDRWGFAPSFALGLGTPTRFSVDYLHEHDRNLPEYGIPLRNFAPVAGINRSNYYGFSNVDVEKIDDDALTAILTHDFGTNATIRNLTRAEQYDRYSITDAAEGRICLDPGQYPLGTNLQAPGTTLLCGAGRCEPPGGSGRSHLHAWWSHRQPARHTQPDTREPDGSHAEVPYGRHRACARGRGCFLEGEVLADNRQRLPQSRRQHLPAAAAAALRSQPLFHAAAQSNRLRQG